MTFTIVDYSERAIALFGDTKPYKGKIMELSGKFNPSLKVENSDERRPGWVFPKTKKSQVEQLIKDINNGEVEPEVVEEKNSYKSNNTPIKSSTVEVSRTDFMNLLSKVERLEQEVNNLKRQFVNSSSSSSSSCTTIKKSIKVVEEEEESEEEQVPKKGLLRKK
jgi:hypothetical protein